MRIKCITPSTLVNTFGGGMRKLALLMAREHPASVLTKYFHEISLLFAFSCGIPIGDILPQKSFKAIIWGNMRRNKSYDDVFLERSPEGYKEYRIIILEETKIDSDRYIQDIDRTLLKWIHEITGSGSKASQSIRSSKSNDLESFISSSTINPRSITTSKSIRLPIQIDVMNDTTEEQVVPCVDTKEKQHNIYNSNNDDGVDLERYKDLLTEGKTYRRLNDHFNRNDGF